MINNESAIHYSTIVLEIEHKLLLCIVECYAHIIATRLQRYEEKVKLPNNLNLFIVFLQQKNCLTKTKEALYDKGKALNMQYLALINQY